MRMTQPKDLVSTNQDFLERDATWPYFTVPAPTSDVGIAMLDTQHRMLIGRLETLERTAAFPSTAFACGSLDVFAELAVKHLYDEKRFLEEMNYPALDTLQREHEWNLIHLQRICEEFRRGDIGHFPDAIEALWQWTIEHIIQSDSRHMPFLASTLEHCA